MNDERRLEAVLNLLANTMTVAMVGLTDAMGGMIGDLADGMGEALGGTRGRGGPVGQSGAKARDTVSQDVSPMLREMATETLQQIREALDTAVARLAPDQRQALLADIRQDSYDKALAHAEQADFGLPPLTGRLSVEDILRYVRIQDPRLGDLIQQVQGLPQPAALREEEEGEPGPRSAGA